MEKTQAEKNEELEQFAHIASHDLREPLTSIAGFATLVRKRYGHALDEMGLRFLDEIINSAQRMEKKLDDLLAFSRVGRTRVRQPFSLKKAVYEAQRALVLAIDETEAEFEIPDDLPVVHGDRSMIAQLFQNLFSNSLKYRGDLAPHITVTAEPHEDHWLIAVKDNGIGFDMKHGERIFGLFQRLYTVEQYPGTGIGLTISRKIIELHGGRIWAESKPDQGSTFFFTLPTVQP